MKRLDLQFYEMYIHTGASKVHLILNDLFVQKVRVIHCDSV